MSDSLRWDDLETGVSRELPAFGNRNSSLALDAVGEVALTGDFFGTIRVGPATGGEPHLLFGHDGMIWQIAATPDGRSIVTSGEDGTIRIWPMPDVTHPPLHALPYEDLLAELRSLTNLRVVPDAASPTGYATRAEPFQGWGEAPTWMTLSADSAAKR